MARKVRDAQLDSRTARSKLKARGKPYYRAIDPGLHLGYRRLPSGVGKWVVRLYQGEQNYAVETIATADDLSDANGVDVLTFAQAQDKARQIRDTRSKAAAGVGPYTVSKALADYFAFLRSEGCPDHLVYDTERRAAALIETELGGIELTELTTDQLRKWRDHLVRRGARTRSGKGQPQKYRPIDDADAMRKRRASVNRTWANVRAALNHAFTEGHAPTDREWKRLKPFRGVDGKRTEYLTIADAKRLINACDPDFRRLVEAALLTGGRYSSLTHLKVRDFHAASGTLTLRTRKGNGAERAFPVTLTPDEGVPFFRRGCAGRGADDLVFTRADGSAWGTNFQADPMREACERAKVKPLGFNQLRHTWAAHAVMRGTPLLVVAKNLGHTSTRMVEAHYAHLAPGYVSDAINAGAPRFGLTPDTNVAELA